MLIANTKHLCRHLLLALLLNIFCHAYSNAQNTYYVKAGASGNGTAWNNALGNIQTAINLANAGDIIYVAAGQYNLLSSLNVNKALKLYGGFAGIESNHNNRNIALLHTANATKIVGDNTLNGSLVNVAPSNANAPITFDGLDFSNAKYGAINISQGVPIINRCKFENNSAVVGGAIYVTAGQTEISNSIFNQNNASLANLYGANYPMPASWTPQNYYTGASVGQDGWINGMNIYLDKEKAMFFDLSSRPEKYLHYIYIGFGIAQTNNPNKIVPIKVYDGTSGAPGNLLGSMNLTMSTIIADVQNSSYSSVNFETPITLPASKKIFVSVDLTNLQWNASVKDALNIISNSNGQTNPSLVWEKQSNNQWYRYGTAGSWNLNSSLLIHPFISSIPINSNLLGAGGAIYNASNGTFKMVNCLFSNNTALNGGAIFNNGTSNTSTDITNTSFYKNLADSKAGAVYNYQYNGGARVAFYNNIIWANNAPSDKDIADDGNNSSIAKNNLTQGFKNGIDLNISEDPMFTNADNNDLSLKAGSPAINMGDATYITGINEDLAGAQRIQLNGLDLGAYESIYPSGNALLSNLNINQGILTPIFNSTTFNYQTTVNNDVSAIKLTPVLRELNAKVRINNTLVSNGIPSDDLGLAVGANIIEIKVTAQDNLTTQTYYLTINREAALPVELLSFNVRAEGNRAKLEWITLQEKNNLKFDIYRKGEEGTFEYLGSKNGLGNSDQKQHYVFYDTSPLPGNNYYRLLQLDNNGQSKEMGIERLRFDLATIPFAFYPNPTTKLLNINVEAGKYQKIRLSNIQGQILKEQQLRSNDTNLIIELGNYAPGQYILTLSNPQENLSRIIIKR